jgi:type III pantothenate kinase
MLNLVIDVGNSAVKTGLFKGKNLLSRAEFSSQCQKETDEWGILLSTWINRVEKKPIIKKVVIASVVSLISTSLKASIKKYFKIKPIEVSSDIVKIPFLCDSPQKLGADRIANVVAACELYKLPAIVIDFGTATTFDVISKKGEYLGGVIAPGITSSLESLSEKTEKLFLVDFKKPIRVIGKNTEENLISGIFYHSLGGVKEILKKIKKEMKEEEVKVIATGGLGVLLKKERKEIEEVNPDLTLQGLNFIGNMLTLEKL